MKDYGVECVGIGIQADHVSEIYKQSVVIDDVKDLSGGIFNQLSELLTGGKVRF
jgi:cobalamin biosynthesis protein CobT